MKVVSTLDKCQQDNNTSQSTPLNVRSYSIEVTIEELYTHAGLVLMKLMVTCNRFPLVLAGRWRWAAWPRAGWREPGILYPESSPTVSSPLIPTLHCCDAVCHIAWCS